MKMQKKMWVSFILTVLLILVSGLMSACTGSNEDGDLEDEDIPEIEQNQAAISPEDGFIVMQIAFDFGYPYSVDLLEFSMDTEDASYYRYQISDGNGPVSPTVLIRHKDGALFTYYEDDGTILALEDDPVLGPYRSADITQDESDTGHGLPGAVDLDLDMLYDHIYDEYDDYYEGYDGYDFVDPGALDTPSTPDANPDTDPDADPEVEQQ